MRFFLLTAFVLGGLFTAKSQDLRVELNNGTIHNYGVGTIDKIDFTANSLQVVPKTGVATIFTLNDVDNLSYTGLVSKTEEVAPASALRIFPNPSNGFFSITAPFALDEKGSLLVYSQTGQLVHEQLLNNQGQNIQENINLSKLPKGIYFVELKTATTVNVEKIILQ